MSSTCRNRTRSFAGAERPRGLDEFQLAHDQHGGAHDAGRMRRRRDRQGDDDIRHRGAEHGATAMASRMAGNAIRASIRRMIGLSRARKKPGRRADERAGDAGHERPSGADGERDPRAVDARATGCPGRNGRCRTSRSPSGGRKRVAEIAAQRIEGRDARRRRAATRTMAQHERAADEEGAVAQEARKPPARSGCGPATAMPGLAMTALIRAAPAGRRPRRGCRRRGSRRDRSRPGTAGRPG